MQTLVAERSVIQEVVRVLIVDRDVDAIRDSRDQLQQEGEFVIHGARNVEDASALLESGAFDVVLVSRRLWDDNGQDLLTAVRSQKRDTAFAVIADDFETSTRAEPTPVVQTLDRRRVREAGYLAAALRTAHDEQRARRRRDTMARWLEREASTDRLTGLLTSRAFDDRLAQSCTEAQGRKQSLAVIIADVTGTQMVNRAHGETIGDDMLRRAAMGISR
jgi:PleD family two-component response regulator